MRRIRLCKFNALLLLAGLCVMGSCAEDELPTDEESADCGKTYGRLVGMFFGSTGEIYGTYRQ